MLDDVAGTEVRAIVRAGQILVLGLVSGVAIFAVVSWYVAIPDPRTAGVLPLVGWIGAAVAALLAALVPARVLKGALRRVAAGDAPVRARGRGGVPGTVEGRVAAADLVRRIVGAALLEAGAFLNLVAWMVAREVTSFGVAVGLGVLMLTFLPTAGGVEAWVEETASRLHDEVL